MSEITYDNRNIYEGNDSPVTLKTRNKFMKDDVVIEGASSAGYTEFTIINEKLDYEPVLIDYLRNTAIFDVIDGKPVATPFTINSSHGYIIPVLNNDVGERYKFINMAYEDSAHEIDVIVVVDGVDYVAPYSDYNHYIIINSDTYYHNIKIYIREHPIT